MAEDELSAVAGWNLANAIRGVVRQSLSGINRARNGSATLTRRDTDGTAWVVMPGSDTETPVNGTEVAGAQPGDTVTWRLEDGRLSITGNASDPAAGTTVVTRAIEESSASLDRGIADVARVATMMCTEITRDIIAIINHASGAGTIDVSKLNLTNYYTSSQVASAISSAINSFTTSTLPTQLNSYYNNFIKPYVDGIETTLRSFVSNAISSAVASIDVGGANLLNNTQWESAADIKTVSSLTEGEWYKDSYATVTYSSGMLVVSTSRTSGHYGCTQKVAVEPSTKYVVSAEVGSTYHIGIGSGTSPDDDGGWVEDGKRVWKAYETGANQAYAYVRMYAEGGGTPSPCVVNRIKLEKATTPSDYSPSNADTSDAVSEAARSATDFITVRDGVTYIEASSIEFVSDYGVFASSEFGAAQRVDLTSIPQVKCGVVGQTIQVPGNSYKEYEVTNAFSYPSPPIVVPCFNSTSTGATFGGLSIAVSSVTTTGFKVRIYNSTTTDRSPGFYWIAVGSHPSA